MNLEFMLKLNTELIQFEDDLAKLHASINAILFSDRDLELMNLTQRHEMGTPHRVSCRVVSCAVCRAVCVVSCRVLRECSLRIRGEAQAPKPYGLF
jgi:hypothetical protein